MIHPLYVDEEGRVDTEIGREDYPRILESHRGLLWIDMERPRQMETVELFSSVFKFHPLSIEDCFHPIQDSRIDVYRDYLFIVAHGLKSADGASRATTTELDLFVGSNYLVTFHNEPSPAIEAVRQNSIHDPRLFHRGVEWLAHAILDALVDDWLPVIDELSDRIEGLEREALERPVRETLAQILVAKRDVLTVHRAAVPFREVISRLSREEFEQMKGGSQVYFRDVYDHLVRIADTSEVLREVAEGALTIYAMSQNNRANEIMKALTVAATVALPSLIIASLYGMNFRHIPELDWRFGYLFALLTMAGISAGLFALFRYKKWL